MALNAVIFDLDDTLLRLKVDWKKLILKIETLYPARCKRPITMKTIWKYFFEVNASYSGLSAGKRKILASLINSAESKGAKESTIFPFSARVVKELSKNYKLGIVSSNSINSVKNALKKFGLLEYFSAIIGRENCPDKKPSPRGILLCLKKLKVKPANAVYVGDHFSDVLAARGAGSKAIAVTTGDTSEKEFCPFRPDAIIPNLGRLSEALEEIGFGETKNNYLVPIRKGKQKMRFDSPAHTGRLKNAVDFVVPEGTPIRAAASGTVVDLKQDSNFGGNAKKFDKFGNYIEIKHGKSEYSIYEHIKKSGSLVKKGERVKEGQIIGYSGKTGMLANLGPHLHFDVHEYFEGWKRPDDYKTLKIRWKK